MYNTSIIEKYSKTKNIISYEEHKLWFLKNLNSKDNKLYILYYNKYKIGYIRITIFGSSSCYISIYLKKKERLKNLGSIYLNCILKIAKNKFKINKVFAEVLKKNILSKFFFTKNQFKLIKYSNRFKSVFNRDNYILLKKI